MEIYEKIFGEYEKEKITHKQEYDEVRNTIINYKKYDKKAYKINLEC